MPVELKPVLRFAKLSEHALPPTKGSAKAAGYDLRRYVIYFYFSTFILFVIIFNFKQIFNSILTSL